MGDWLDWVTVRSWVTVILTSAVNSARTVDHSYWATCMHESISNVLGFIFS